MADGSSGQDLQLHAYHRGELVAGPKTRHSEWRAAGFVPRPGPISKIHVLGGHLFAAWNR